MLVEGLIARFRYLDETIAVVLGVVGVKLLAEDLYKVGPVLSLVVIFVLFAVGIAASLWADSRDPDAERKREERKENLQPSGGAGGGAGYSSSRFLRSSSRVSQRPPTVAIQAIAPERGSGVRR